MKVRLKIKNKKCFWMKTQILSQNDTLTAAKILNAGGVVAIPTETVYGLAANAFNNAAVRKIFGAKGRPSDNPLIVHISQVDEIYALVQDFTEDAQKLAEAFWPGPLTIILKKSDAISKIVSGGLDSVALRLPEHPVARKIINKTGLPLVAPSANTSGRPSPTSAAHVIADLGGKIDAVVDAGRCKFGVESTVISLCEAVPKILRPGAVTLEQIRCVLGNAEIDNAVLNPIEDGVRPISPGTKYKHYAPRADVTILKGTRGAYIDYINNNCSGKNIVALCYDEDIPYLKVSAISYGKEADSTLQAEKLFDSLRAIDKIEGVDAVYARCPSKCGIGLAVYNRLLRAAGFHIIEI